MPLYFVYTATRAAADSSAADAIALGWRLQRFAEALHVDVELALNHWVTSIPALAIVCCYFYATLHFIVTPAVLAWMHRRHRERYAQARWTLVLTTLISLAGFFAFPTAPPRLLDGAGYVDTMARFAAWGWWSSSSSAAPGPVAGLANPYAALPSLHCAWALWCGFLLVRHARPWPVRVLGALYPLASAFVVTGTANHYLVDVLAGWAVLGFAAFVTAEVARYRCALAGAEAPAGADVARPARAGLPTT